MGFKSIFDSLLRKVADNSSDILAGIGIIGFFTTIVLAVTATPKAEAALIEAEDEKGDDLTTVEKVKAAWKAYVPAGVTAIASTACIVGAEVKNHAHTAELTTAYALSQAVIKKYDEKIAEIDGEERGQQIKNAVHNSIRRTPVAQEEMVKLPAQKSGLHPFYDPMSNHGFYASKEIIDKAEVQLNKRLYSDGETYVTVNDLYDELNDAGVYPPLKHTSVGSKLCFYADRGGVCFSLIDKGEWDDGTPCYVMGFKINREPDYIR